MPGPRAKSSGRQRRNEVKNHPVVVPTSSDLVANPPDAPKKWLKITKDAWADFWTQDVARAVVKSDLPALRRLFELRDLEERLMRKAAEENYVTVGSTGQPVIHPALKQADALRAEIRNLEDRFGLTPASRAKLGIDHSKLRRSLSDLAQEAAQPNPEDDPRRRS